MKLIRKKHLAFYGNTGLERKYCKNCKCMSIVIDNKLQCCDNYVDEKEWDGRTEMLSNPRPKRNKPSLSAQRDILEKQEGKCFYCGIPFNSVYLKNVNILHIRIHFDHIVPFSYNQNNNKNNFVASCNICNSIKSNKIFKNMEDLVNYVEEKRKQKGIVFYEDLQELQETDSNKIEE